MLHITDSIKRNITYQPCIYSTKLIDKLQLIQDAGLDITLIKKAVAYAQYFHSHQKRDSGEPYYSHPLEVALIVTDYIINTDVIIVSILHAKY